MTRFKFSYEPDQAPRLPFQKDLHRVACDLDRMVIEAESIEKLCSWTLSLIRQIYPGAEQLGPVTRSGGAVIFCGDTGDIHIRPVYL